MTTNIDIQPQFSAGPKHSVERLTRLQRSLYEKIADKNQEIADMFLGGILILSDETNPDRIALSAHGFREMMEKIPKLVDVPIKSSDNPIGNKVRTLEAEWDKVLGNTNCNSTGTWAGEIDNALKNMLETLEDFFINLKKDVPKRREERTMMFRGFSESGSDLPQNILDKSNERWMNLYGFFTGTSHHSMPREIEIIREKVKHLEAVLTELLNPRTLEDFDEIDNIIKEGEDES